MTPSTPVAPKTALPPSRSPAHAHRVPLRLAAGLARLPLERPTTESHTMLAERRDAAGISITELRDLEPQDLLLTPKPSGARVIGSKAKARHASTRARGRHRRRLA